MQAKQEAKEAAAQAAAQEAARQKALALPRAALPRSQKPLTEPKDIEFQTAKRQRTQDATASDKVSDHHKHVAPLLCCTTHISCPCLHVNAVLTYAA